jgi:hypothetical protein
VDFDPDWGSEVAMGLGDIANDISILFGDGDGGECSPGLCHDWGAVSWVDLG